MCHSLIFQINIYTSVFNSCIHIQINCSFYPAVKYQFAVIQYKAAGAKLTNGIHIMTHIKNRFFF